MLGVVRPLGQQLWLVMFGLFVVFVLVERVWAGRLRQRVPTTAQLHAEHRQEWGGIAGSRRRHSWWSQYGMECRRCGATPNTKRRRKFRKERGELCDFELHHARYLPGATGSEPDPYLVGLCEDCHQLITNRHQRWFHEDHWPYRWLWLTTWVTIRCGRFWWRFRRLRLHMPSYLGLGLGFGPAVTRTRTIVQHG